MSQTSVSSTRNTTFASGNTLGRVLGHKKPLREWGTHFLDFPHKNTVASYVKTLGRVLGGIRSPCGNGHTHSLGFKNTVFSYVKPWGVFLRA